MEQPAHALIVEHVSEPSDLSRRLQKRMIAIDGRVLAFDDIRDFAVRRGSDFADSLNVLRDKQEVVRIDLPLFDEATGLLRASARIGLIDQSALIVHEAMQIATGAGWGLAEVVGRHLHDLAANRIARAQDFTERENKPLFAIKAKEHPRRAGDFGFLDENWQIHGHAFRIG